MLNSWWFRRHHLTTWGSISSSIKLIGFCNFFLLTRPYIFWCFSNIFCQICGEINIIIIIKCPQYSVICAQVLTSSQINLSFMFDSGMSYVNLECRYGFLKNASVWIFSLHILKPIDGWQRGASIRKLSLWNGLHGRCLTYKTEWELSLSNR